MFEDSSEPPATCNILNTVHVGGAGFLPEGDFKKRAIFSRCYQFRFSRAAPWTGSSRARHKLGYTLYFGVFNPNIKPARTDVSGPVHNVYFTADWMKT